MTNVPQNIRNLWTDIYVLFDRNYLMPNTKEAWGKFWEQVEPLREKYKECPYLWKMLDVVVSVIECRMKEEDPDYLNVKRPCSLEQMNLF